MEKQFCAEHSDVMRCLGSLEESTDRNYKAIKDVQSTIHAVENKLDGLRNDVVNGKISTMVEQTKSSILYWVIGAVVISAIGIIFSRYLFTW